MITDLVRSRAEDLLAQAARVEQLYSQYLVEKIREVEGDRRSFFYINKQKLARVLDEVGPFTEDTLFIGIADDGLPILLDLNDPTTGAMLFVGDQYAGKTPQLKAIAAALEFTHTPEQVKFAVLTDKVNNWRDLQDSPNIINIFSYRNPGTSAFLEGLVNWTNVNRNSSQVIILLVDGVDKISQLPPEARDNLIWLLRYGAENKVWTFGTLETRFYQREPQKWQRLFPTQVYGKMQVSDDTLLGYSVPAFVRRRGEFVLGSSRGPVLRFHTPLLPLQ